MGIRSVERAQHVCDRVLCNDSSTNEHNYHICTMNSNSDPMVEENFKQATSMDLDAFGGFLLLC